MKSYMVMQCSFLFGLAPAGVVRSLTAPRHAAEYFPPQGAEGHIAAKTPGNNHLEQHAVLVVGLEHLDLDAEAPGQLEDVAAVGPHLLGSDFPQVRRYPAVLAAHRAGDGRRVSCGDDLVAWAATGALVLTHGFRSCSCQPAVGGVDSSSPLLFRPLAIGRKPMARGTFFLLR